VWLEQHRKPLLQPHFGEAPQPPEALKEVYGVRAQTLGLIVVCGGWISINSLREREWGAQDMAALAEATQRVHDAVDSI
jgi:maleate isomerase